MELSNHTILITGGTSGIGLELAAQLLDRGNTVIIRGRNQARLDQAQQKLPGIHTIQSDVSIPAQITSLYDQVIKEFPDLNFLINNAGEMRRLDLHDVALDVNDITREIEINLSGPIRMIHQFLPHLQKKNNAVVLNVTSGIAFVPFPLSPIYSASKAGLQSYTRALRIRLKKDNIKVVELAAPAANTPLNDKFSADNTNTKMLMDADKLVRATLKGLENDQYQIKPGMARMLALLSRLAPGFIFNVMARMAEKAFAQPQTELHSTI